MWTQTKDGFDATETSRVTCVGTGPGSLPVLLGGMAALYASFGFVFGLAQGAAPVLLRARGIPLASVGWTFALLLPFGLTFLWAPLVDLYRPFRSMPKIGWIVVMQVVIVALLVVLSRGAGLSPPSLMTIGLAIAFAAATMDIALDGLATMTVPARARPIAGGLKLAALSTGSMLGGGVMVAVAGRLGWSGIFSLAALLNVLSIFPILFARRWDRDQGTVQDAAARHRPDFFAVLKSPALRMRLGLLLVATCVIVPLFSLNRIMLLDLKVSPGTIGWVVGLGAPACGLIASLLAIPLFRRFGGATTLFAFTALCLASVAAMIAGLVTHLASLATLGAATINAGTSGTYVIFYAIILGWAQGPQPATDYAMIYGLSRLAATLLLIAFPHAISLIGWPGYYGTLSVALVLIVLWLWRRLPELSASAT